MTEPERRMLGRTDWAFVHQNPARRVAHGGLARAAMSANG